MASHSYFQVRKKPADAPGKTYRIQQQTPQGFKTVGTSNSRVKANQSAGIRDSQRLIKQRGRKA